MEKNTEHQIHIGYVKNVKNRGRRGQGNEPHDHAYAWFLVRLFHRAVCAVDYVVHHNGGYKMNRTLYVERAERRMAAQNNNMEYKTLEQQIAELWASRGLQVVLEKFCCLKDGRARWTIYAKPPTPISEIRASKKECDWDKWVGEGTAEACMNYMSCVGCGAWETPKRKLNERQLTRKIEKARAKLAERGTG